MRSFCKRSKCGNLYALAYVFCLRNFLLLSAGYFGNLDMWFICADLGISRVLLLRCCIDLDHLVCEFIKGFLIVYSPTGPMSGCFQSLDVAAVGTWVILQSARTDQIFQPLMKIWIHGLLQSLRFSTNHIFGNKSTSRKFPNTDLVNIKEISSQRLLLRKEFTHFPKNIQHSTAKNFSNRKHTRARRDYHTYSSCKRISIFYSSKTQCRDASNNTTTIRIKNRIQASY